MRRVRLDGGGTRFAWHFDAGRRDSDDYEIPGYAHADVDAGNADPDDAFGVLDEQRGRERIRCVRRVLARR